MTRVRLIAWVTVCTLFGAAVTIGVAWFAARYAGDEGVEYSMTFSFPDPFVAWWNAHCPWDDGVFRSNALESGPFPDVDEHSSHLVEVGGTVMPIWSYHCARAPGLTMNRAWHQFDDQRGVMTAYRLSAGWPMHALVGSCWERSQSNTAETSEQVFVHAIDIASMVDRGNGGEWDFMFERFIPYGIRSVGFIVDTIVYGGALALLRFGVPAVRASWRRRRSRCAACGYRLVNTSGERCPECGTATS